MKRTEEKTELEKKKREKERKKERGKKERKERKKKKKSLSPCTASSTTAVDAATTCHAPRSASAASGPGSQPAEPDSSLNAPAAAPPRRDERVGRGEAAGVDAADHLVRALEARGPCLCVFSVLFWFFRCFRGVRESVCFSLFCLSPSLSFLFFFLSQNSQYRGAGAASSAPRGRRSTGAAQKRTRRGPGRARRRR